MCIAVAVVNTMAKLLKKRRKWPREALPFVLGKVIPGPVLEAARQYSSSWEDRGEYITFRHGGFAGGTSDRPEFSARNYYEITQLRSLLEEYDVSATRSAEVGCGYGRLSPWIADFSTQHYGIDPNETQIEKARTLYPDCRWVESTAQDLPFDDGHFDLVVTWTVLQHIPPESIRKAIRQIERVSADRGRVILCEETEGEAGVNTWPRSTAEYSDLFASFSLVETRDRDLEPTFPDHGGEIMVFGDP